MTEETSILTGFSPEFLRDTGSLHSCLQMAGIGTWEFRLNNNLIFWDDECRLLFGVKQGNSISYSEALKIVYKEDLESVTQAVILALKGNNSGNYNMVFRIFSLEDGIRWINLIGKTYTDEYGKHTLFSGIARNITELKNNESLRLIQQETETALLGAIELAELGTWTLDLTTGIYQYSERLREWFGFKKDEIITTYKMQGAIDKRNWPLLDYSLSNAIKKGSTFRYDLEYKIKAYGTSQERIVHSQGKVFFDDAGIAIKISGTAQDVTIQRELQIALEQEVQERTMALATSNEKLAEKVLEVASTNADLVQSNQELEQYAYIASHDLQEPLRKIRIFSSRLLTKIDPEESQSLLKKIHTSAERMTMLIQNVLEFSKLLELHRERTNTDLNLIVATVIDDFELMIAEKHAVIEIDPLPFVEAIPIQMHQLFQNLVGNALKFSRPDVVPKVSIQCQVLEKDEAKTYVSPILPYAQYYKISFSDNGIGFETQYSDRIFEIFQRLNNREDYEGAGIGLALCKRIVSNHLGNLAVASEPGTGTIFSIVLPDKQKQKAT
ncbi:MAG: PAS domain-containing protein [Cyclobacteriaceae bacterium]|nr:PAS domain-containing protein [Cyclobacteriaceae bacterium]